MESIVERGPTSWSVVGFSQSGFQGRASAFDAAGRIKVGTWNSDETQRRIVIKSLVVNVRGGIVGPRLAVFRRSSNGIEGSDEAVAEPLGWIDVPSARYLTLNDVAVWLEDRILFDDVPIRDGDLVYIQTAASTADRLCPQPSGSWEVDAQRAGTIVKASSHVLVADPTLVRWGSTATTTQVQQTTSRLVVGGSDGNGGGGTRLSSSDFVRDMTADVRHANQQAQSTHHWGVAIIIVMIVLGLLYFIYRFYSNWNWLTRTVHEMHDVYPWAEMAGRGGSSDEWDDDEL